MYLGSGVGDDYDYSFSFLCGWIHDRFGLFWHPRDDQRCLWGCDNDPPKWPVQRNHSGERWSGQSILNGYGVSLNCLGRGPCLQLGDLLNANHYNDMTVKGIHFRTPTVSTGNAAFGGSAITGIVVSGGSATITTSAPHGLH